MTLEIGITRDPRMNQLIRSLPDEEYARILPKLELVSLPLGKVLFESGDKLSHIYFPSSSVVSLLYIMENGGTAEIGIAGKGGLVGMPLFLGGDTTTGRAVVQSAGKAYRMKAADLKAEFARGGEFQNVLLLYTQAMMTQISQTAVCNRLHSIHQQLCRWLLISHDQLVGDKLVMTHDLIANMLGVRREGVTHPPDTCRTKGTLSIPAERLRYWTEKASRMPAANAIEWSRTSTAACCTNTFASMSKDGPDQQRPINAAWF